MAELTDRLQSALSAINRPAGGVSTRGMVGLLQDCLMRITAQQKKIDQYEAERDTPRYQSGRVYHSLIRNQAYKIRTQKARIKELEHTASIHRKAYQMIADLSTRQKAMAKPMDTHYAEIKKAANNGDLIRVLALLEDWGSA